MRAILIDPAAQRVEEVAIEGDLDSLQKAVDGYIEVATTFANNDTLFVNEEGMLQENHYFCIGAHQPFAGTGIILGMNGEGASQDAQSDLEWVRGCVRFGSPRMLMTR